MKMCRDWLFVVALMTAIVFAAAEVGAQVSIVLDDFNDDVGDLDGDGITDDIDTQPNNPSNDFEDTTNNPTTEGTITTHGDQDLTIGQEPVPDGVLFNAEDGGGNTPAQIIACNNLSQISVDSGESGKIT